MLYFSSHRVVFDAGHMLKLAGCEKQHGHRYTVAVTWEREGFHETDQLEWIRVRDLIIGLRTELHGRELNAMLGAAYPNAYGVASFFMDRLAISVPVTRVEVQESDGEADGPHAIIERDPHN